MSTPVTRLKKRADFLRASRGRKFVTSSFILLGFDREDTEEARVGFTTTKKLGNAVVRNRIRRRLREAVRLGGPEVAVQGWDYVLIARTSALHCPFEALMRDVRLAFPNVLKAKFNEPRR